MSRIAVCGLVRDCRKALSRNWLSLKKLRDEFQNVDWVFVENDSIDGSRQWLEGLASRTPGVHIVGENLNEVTIPARSPGKVRPAFSIQRISKMAFFRNQYLAVLRERVGLANLDAVVVIDFDVAALPVDCLIRHLRDPDAETVVTALGTGYHRGVGTEFYDCYAFRESGATAPQTYAEIDSQRRSLWQRFKRLAGPIEVDSNFNGCAIYPAKAFEDASYMVLPNDDPEVECFVEHVGLHKQMRDKGYRIVLDPQLTVHYSTFRSYWVEWFQRRCRHGLRRKDDLIQTDS